MFSVERQNKIKEILLKYKQINVNSLATMLDVTKTTIRKDLDTLEQEGFLRKMHGGAVLNDHPATISNSDMLSISGENIEEKKLMASIASQLIRNNDIIFLGGGSTCSCIADALLKNNELANLTVATNNLYVVNRLSEAPNITLICMGGQVLRLSSKDFYGPMTNKQISENYFNKAFITVNAISLKNGYMVARPEYQELINIVKKQSEECYILADHTKFDQNSMIKLSDLSDIPKIITDRKVPDSYKTYCFYNNIQLFTTVEAETQTDSI